jgi:hypothetical protein
MVLNLTKDFDCLMLHAVKKLTEDGPVMRVNYLHGLDTEIAKSENKKTLDSLLKDGANIYAIWIRKHGLKKWHLMYIGQRKSSSVKVRLCQHLFKKDEKTGSQLSHVKEALKYNNEIGISVIRVHPDELRTSVEERLINLMKSKGHCPWNIHS